jgi:uncharacterized membrane protein
MRPKLQLDQSMLEHALGLASIAGILYTTVQLYLVWDHLPTRIPTHFGVSGRPDGWGGKTSLLVLLAVSVGMFLMLTVISRFPHWCNFPWRITEENAERQYRIVKDMLAWMKAELVWLFTYIIWATQQVALQKAEGLSPWFLPAFLLIIFFTTGYYLLEGYQNR